MESFVDSMMQTPEGIAQYDTYMAEPTELTDSAEIAQMAEMQTTYYYTHMFYSIHHPEMLETEMDSTNTDMCYIGVFKLRNVHRHLGSWIYDMGVVSIEKPRSGVGRRFESNVRLIQQ